MQGEGIITKPSKYSVDETLNRLQAALRGKGIKIFAEVDHSGEAEKVGLKMPPTRLLIFGDPKGGTPIMLAAPLAAIDLPVKALVWQDQEGKVWLSYNDSEYVRQRFGLGVADVAALARLGNLLQQVLQ